jgi:outer membrane protein, heavy metal efflux system
MRWLLCASVLALFAGCRAYSLDIEGRIAERASEAIDVRPVETLEQQPRKLPGVPTQLLPPTTQLLPPTMQVQYGIIRVKKEADKPGKEFPSMMQRLEFKEGLLGIKIDDIQMPPNTQKKEFEAAIQKYFPPLPAPAILPEAAPGPNGQALTLTDLQQIALRANPKIHQAHLDIESARGAALQAGLYPNPNIAYEGSAIGQGNQDGQRSPGQQGGFIEQTIVTAGKKTIARDAALRDVQIAEQRLKQTEAELQAQVRAGYFAVLSARENYRVTRGLTELTDELFGVLLLQMRAGEVAAYEPMQIRVLAMQSRQALAIARNRYVSAWKQLAANLGTPTMPLTVLGGRIDMPVPHFIHDEVLAYVLDHHTDVISSHLGVEKHRLLMRLAEVQPYPDVTLHTGFQKDYTTPPFGAIANVSVSVPFPLWDRNQGNIQSARASLRRAMEDNLRVRNDLTARTAEAFERYDNNTALLEMYKKHILPNQVQAFRAALARHNVVGGVSYLDVVTSQQTLASLIGNYLNALNDQWTAVIDIANLLQTPDLFQMHPVDHVAPIPDVYEIFRRERGRH